MRSNGTGKLHDSMLEARRTKGYWLEKQTRILVFRVGNQRRRHDTYHCSSELRHGQHQDKRTGANKLIFLIRIRTITLPTGVISSEQKLRSVPQGISYVIYRATQTEYAARGIKTTTSVVLNEARYRQRGESIRSLTFLCHRGPSAIYRQPKFMVKTTNLNK